MVFEPFSIFVQVLYRFCTKYKSLNNSALQMLCTKVQKYKNFPGYLLENLLSTSEFTIVF